MTDVKLDIDLRPLLGAVRDQGPRPTCLAFAMSDAHTAARGDPTPLSCEHLYYHALAVSGGSPFRGASVANTRAALKGTGQPLESDWPYLSVKPQDLPNNWGPPNGIGKLFRRDAAEHTANLKLVTDAIQDGAPIVAVMYLSPSFYNPADGGIIAMKTGETPILTAVHAVLCVGIGTLNGESVILIRNSWGEGWGIAGHAWITETNLQNLLISAAELGDDPHVSDNSLAA